MGKIANSFMGAVMAVTASVGGFAASTQDAEAGQFRNKYWVYKRSNDRCYPRIQRLERHDHIRRSHRFCPENEVFQVYPPRGYDPRDWRNKHHKHYRKDDNTGAAIAGGIILGLGIILNEARKNNQQRYVAPPPPPIRHNYNNNAYRPQSYVPLPDSLTTLPQAEPKRLPFYLFNLPQDKPMNLLQGPMVAEGEEQTLSI